MTNPHISNHSSAVGITRRGLIVGAVAAGAGVGVTGVGSGRAVAAGTGGRAPGLGAGRTPRGFPGFEVPRYAIAVPGESLVTGRADWPVAPGIVLTSFDIFGRAGWTRVHVLNADLGAASVGVDLIAGQVSQARPLARAADDRHAVAAVNGDYFDITETYAAEGPEIQAGRLRKGTDEPTTVAAIGADRVARLADLVLDGTVTVAGARHPLAALNSPTVPADGIAVFTPLWGPGDRTLIQDPGPYTELVVVKDPHGTTHDGGHDAAGAGGSGTRGTSARGNGGTGNAGGGTVSSGTVGAVNSAMTATPVPDGGLIVVGRGAAARALAGVRPGDRVSVAFAPRSDAPAVLRTALGSGAVLVRGGTATDFPPSTGNDAAKPRTAVGWPAGGHRLLLVAVDGSANFSAGLGFDGMAALMLRLGAADAFMLDGGGSTELVARRPGDRAAGVVNTPSDGGERPVSNGLGLFGRPGSGRPRGLDVRPGADRVVPGLTVDLAAAGYDETWAPVAVAGADVSWSARPGSLGRVGGGVFRAGRPGAGSLRARAGDAHGEHGLRVLGDLHRLAFSEPAVTVDPGATATVRLTGYDADGFDAPVAPRDVVLDYDPAVVTVTARGDGGLDITGAADADGKAAVVTASVRSDGTGTGAGTRNAGGQRTGTGAGTGAGGPGTEAGSPGASTAGRRGAGTASPGPAAHAATAHGQGGPAPAHGVTARLPVTVGLADTSLAGFEPGESWSAAAARGTASVAVVAAADRPGADAGNHALRLTYDFTGQPSTSAAYAVAGPGPITLPPGTERLALWVNGDGRGHWLRATLASQGTTNVPFTFALTVDWTGWRRVVGDLPAGFSEPITLSRIYLAETSQTGKGAGQVDFDGLTAQVGRRPDTAQPPRPDPYVVEQGTVPDRRWTFAVLSDLHVSAAAGLDSFSGRQAAAALAQVVAGRPDFILINGDFVDNDNPEDFALANGLLHDHVPAGLPVYWTPGNHEAGLSATGGLDAFHAATGRPSKQVVDHKGVRFVLLDSHTGDMRTSDWSQVPLLRAELDKAAVDRSVTGVVVSFHHPLHDPSGAGASQLADQLEADLLKRWLADFRETSGKPVALFNGHAHTAAVTRSDGVLEVNTPAVGKTPYSSPDQGGFFGWMHVGVDPRPGRVRAGQPSPDTREWLVAESRPLIDGIDLADPGPVPVGGTAALAATGITSEFGLRFPLRFPATVTWGGGPGVVVSTAATGADAARTARAARRDPRTLAVLDARSATLTAVRPGTVTVTVASGGLTARTEVALG